LLNPIATIERELREELIIVEPDAQYVFGWEQSLRSAHPDFDAARRFWHELLPGGLPSATTMELPLKWLSAPDAVVIRFDDRPPIQIDDCILNINARDFGIEIDRVAKVSVGPEAVLLDGEIYRGGLLNRVIGLFEVHAFHAALAAGRLDSFRPQRVFYNGCDRSADGLDVVIGEYLARLEREGLWARDAPSIPDGPRFGLCPVTRRLVQRHLSVLLPHDGASPERHDRGDARYDTFLSFASEDKALATEVFEFLRRRGRRVFFSDETHYSASFSTAIDDALASARTLIVVGTREEHFTKPWVEYEWRTFHNAILSSRKPKKTPLVAVALDLNPSNLPPPLQYHSPIVAAASTHAAIDRLNKILD
jgi:hypothetical protein